MSRYSAEPCGCGCKDWHVSPVAAIQGVGFTHEQALAVAELLNTLELAKHGPRDGERMDVV